MTTATLDPPTAAQDVPREPAAAGRVGTAEFDASVQDCRVTITSPSGEHRTFWVKTIRHGRHEGRRLVHLMRGTYNDEGGDWLPFGEAPVGGPIAVWPGFLAARFVDAGSRRSRFAAYADLLSRPLRYEGLGCLYNIHGYCRDCGRALTTRESVLRGLGPKCRRRA